MLNWTLNFWVKSAQGWTFDHPVSEWQVRSWTQNQSSSIVGLNLVRLAYEEFTKEHNLFVFENFEWLEGVEPLLFLQLCIYYFADMAPAVIIEIQTEDSLVYYKAVTKNRDGKIISKTKIKISIPIKINQ